ncbi:hypothetical protein SNE40_015363 [Patella caerulea]|uniref:Uncharacterized protein n=1 Tax=Patella caerulea TaxID=87958 RepID=A0AAN8JKG4_PATCE
MTLSYRVQPHRQKLTKQNVSTLTLHLDDEQRPFLSPPSSEADINDGDYFKQIRQRRKCYGKLKTSARQSERDKTFLNMALSGKPCLENLSTTNTQVSKTSEEMVKLPNSVEQNRRPTSKPIVGDLNKTAFTEKNENLLPPVSQILQIRPDWETKSYLKDDFGFSNQRTDSFLGIKTSSFIKTQDDLDGKMAAQARRHLFACANVGSVRKSCRANESVYRLKQTLRPISEKRRTVFSGPNPTQLERFSTVPKPTRVFTRSEITRRVTLDRGNTFIPEINGFSILN